MTRILFADDDASLIRSVKRWLYGKRDTWEAEFAESAEDAWSILEQTEVDVVVSDMRMPGADGAELLNMIRQVAPDTIRCILSGFSATDSAVRSVAGAHQFFAKPVDFGWLTDRLSKIIERRDTLPEEQWRMINGIDSFPSHSTDIANALASLMTPHPDLSDISSCALRDPALMAKMLQLGGSSFFGTASNPLDVGMIVEHLGSDVLSQLASTAEFAHIVNEEDSALVLYVESVRQHCLDVCEVVRAANLEETQRRELTAVTMIHGVGHLAVMDDEHVRSGGALNCTPQRFTELGLQPVPGYVATLWGMDERLIQAVDVMHSTEADTCSQAVLANLDATRW